MSKITEPGQYLMDEATYNADPVEGGSLRSSLAWKLVERGSTPRHAWFASPLNPQHRPVQARQLDFGRACHTMLLGKGQEFAIIDATSYKTGDAQRAKAAAYEAGKTPLLTHEYKTVQAMAIAAREQLIGLVAAGTLPAMPFQDGEAENVLVWRDRGVMCRAMLDGLPRDGEFLYEYKSTAASAHPDLFQFRNMRQLGYDFQLGFYRRGLEALNICHSASCCLLVQENFEPYLLSMIRVDDELIALANEKVERALKIWARCVRTNTWPGYDVAGYDVGPTERERQQETAERPQSAHIESTDIPDSAYSSPFAGKKK